MPLPLASQSTWIRSRPSDSRRTCRANSLICWLAAESGGSSDASRSVTNPPEPPALSPPLLQPAPAASASSAIAATPRIPFTFDSLPRTRDRRVAPGHGRRIVAGHMILRLGTVAGNSVASASHCQNRRMAVPRMVVPLVALAYGIAVLVVKPWASDPPTTYAAASTLAAAVGLVAGIGLLASGSALWLERGRDRAAVLLVLAGVAWFAPDWLGWDDGPSIVRSVAAVVAPFLPALLLDLVATVSGSRVARLSSYVLYASTLVVSVGRALFRDPFLDAHCWSNCTDNLFLVDADQGIARALDSALPRVILAAGVLVISFSGLEGAHREPGRETRRAASPRHTRVRRCGGGRLRPRSDPRSGRKGGAGVVPSALPRERRGPLAPRPRLRLDDRARTPKAVRGRAPGRRPGVRSRGGHAGRRARPLAGRSWSGRRLPRR